MLGFFDESGDPGLKIDAGSSRFFVVALVTFADEAEALRCDRRIAALRGELHLPAGYEFHFAKNSRRVREAFLGAVQPFDFRYHLLALDKRPEALYRLGRKSNADLFRYTAGAVFANAAPFLKNAAIFIDKRGGKRFGAELAGYLRGHLKSPGGDRLIQTVKQQESHKNNLLQLADYVASIGNRAISGKRDGVELQERYLRAKEITSQIQPK